MPKTCSKCKKPAVTFIRYNGTHLCKDHFIKYFEKRVKKEVKKQGKTKGKSKKAIALSGGKDSSISLYISYDLYKNRKNIELFAITVDEGIKNYREKSIEIAKQNCKKLGIKQYIVSFKDVFGITMDEIHILKEELGDCAYCGVFRRVCLNKKAKELGAQSLITGHNLDDMAQSILMNFVNGDVQKLARLGPHKKVQPGFVPRLSPLRVIPEKEVALYAILKKIDFHEGKCPYSTDALRGNFRDIIDSLEYNSPGTRHSILKSYDAIKDILLEKFPPIELKNCIICGEPTSQIKCKSCVLKEKLN